MSNQKLLIETHLLKNQVRPLNESTNHDNGNLVVEGILATVEVKNGNGRYYSRDIWEREIEKYSPLIEQRRATGELDHPESQVINLKNVSHIIKEYWWEGNNIIGKIEILPTPSGKILRTLIEQGIIVGVSSRGLGSLEEVGGIMEVQDDFELLCFDFVSTPSNPNSFMYPTSNNLNESMVKQSTDYSNINNIIYEILCSKGSCPLE